MQKLDAINWFPGHMAKAYRLIRAHLPLVDAVLELVDARAPLASKSPYFEQLLAKKPRIIILTKSDLADPHKTALFKRHLSSEFHAPVVELHSNTEPIKQLGVVIRSLLSKKQQSNLQRGMRGRTLKLMVIGIPNVGKSTLINRCARGSKAKVENRPGVTKSKQWIRLEGQLELLDTPGVLWPKFEEKMIGVKLALIGSIKEELLDTTGLAIELLRILISEYPELLSSRYKLSAADIQIPPVALLKTIGEKRNVLMKAGEIDIERVGFLVLKEFRMGAIGGITLDTPE
ncbi:MAG: ribosome biogenesis GTPase YlqF [Oscillospiraceae bacterium]|jgi:ribosome biogenesis GTPase A|nr:ribosome biogenesis GTPase YlqF [Oscillospiraceae bacterium]